MLGLIDSRLSIAARLGLIASIFLMPIAFLAYLFVAQASGDIAFARKEMAGSIYLTQIWPGFAQTALTDAINAEVRPDHKHYDADFGTVDAAAAYDKTGDVASRLSTGKTLIGAVADGSNLTLDPDLDSFYAMDAATVRLPGIMVAAHAIAEAAAEPVASPSRLAHIAVAVDRLQISADDADSSLGASMKANPLTAATLSPHAIALKAAVAGLAEQGRALLDGHPADDLAARKTALFRQIDATFSATNHELARLLQVRIDGFLSKLITSLGLASAFIVAAILLSSTIARGLGRRIANLLRVMDRLIANDTAVEIPCLNDRNETGRIAHTLAAFKASVVERTRLKSQINLEHELAEERRRSSEAQDAAARAQARVVKAIADGLDRLSNGDLVYRLQESFPAHYEKLRTDFNSAISKLQRVIEEVAVHTGEIRAQSDSLSNAADDLARRTEQQAQSIEETAAALEQITATVKSTANGAVHVRDVVTTTRADAERSSGVVRAAIAAISSIQKSSQEIGQIITVIDEIAFQTNLLALNAGVEAARAGEAGRGFAVVASEVRALAQRSAEAAKQIKTLISTSTAQVNEGVGLVGQTGATLERVVTQVAEISGLITAITASAEEQAIGLAQINTAIEQMDQVTQQNATMVERSTEATHDLAGQTETLAVLIGHFNVGGNDAPTALKQKGQAAMSGPRQGSSASRTVTALKTSGRGGAAPKPESKTDERDWTEF